jgi:ABC-type uncharacterized transport system involved in gliding motility auxiliary subunit
MKIIAVNWKYLKYLVWFGFSLIVMGVTAGLVANSWGVVPLSLIGVGVVFVLLWLGMSGNAESGFWGRRSTQAGTNALVATLAVLVILGLINFLGVRYAQRVDLTETQLYTLAPQSIQVVKQIQQPVKVWIFENTAPNTQDKELLENYRRQNDQFSYQYIDPQADPGLAQRFGVQSFGEVYLESGDKRNFLQTMTPEERLSERTLTNGLAQIGSDRQLKVYFTQGHGEKTLQGGQNGLSVAVAQLTEKSYVPEPLTLTDDGKVPDDAAVVVVAGPQRELLAAEVKALQDYLKRQSGLLLMLDPLSKPGVNSLLQDWGVTLSDRVVIDPAGQAAGLGPTVALVTQYGDHPITQEFGNGISLFPIAQPLGVADKPDQEEMPLLFSDDRAQAQQVSPTGELQFDPNGEGQGSLTLGVALSRTIEDADENQPEPSPEASPAEPDEDQPAASDQAESKPEARLVVIGNSGFATDGLFNQQLNGDVFLNSVSWLSQQDDRTLSIRPKEMTNRRIVLSAQQQTLVSIAALAVLPLLGFGAALVSWLRRR